MAANIKLFLIITTAALQSNGVSLRRQLGHNGRRNFYKYDPREISQILGAPSLPSHLPEAEPILPGHTLLKPAMGMLKSAVKFPHKDFEDGSGVYGNADNIGIRYDSKNERVLYSGFRRMPSDYIVITHPDKRYQTRQAKRLLRWNANKKNGIFDSYNDYGNREAGYNENEIQQDEDNTMASLWNVKSPFDHLVINQNAPEFFDLFPPSATDHERQSWFYNGANQPLNEDYIFRNNIN